MLYPGVLFCDQQLVKASVCYKRSVELNRVLPEMELATPRPHLIVALMRNGFAVQWYSMYTTTTLTQVHTQAHIWGTSFESFHLYNTTFIRKMSLLYNICAC